MPDDQIAGLLYTDISDHLPLFVINKTTLATSQPPSAQYYRQINEGTISAFKNLLGHESWTEILLTSDPDMAYDLFANKFLDYYKTAFPFVKRHTKRRNHKPWVTRAIKKSIEYKNKLYKPYHSKPTLFNEIKYKNIKRQLVKTIRHAEKLHYKTAGKQ